MAVGPRREKNQYRVNNSGYRKDRNQGHYYRNPSHLPTIISIRPWTDGKYRRNHAQ